ncbi:TadE/TadG family type IV pilus assembly protein (plasmid) [Streptomyces sp. AM 4-1-1]|uniref:TadE family protein n=1 Tax=Streptomyces sp. AM 4-1-1 TaxID=3028710 RepID=UPI0023B98A86|nr:TadE/TadG family type IV pilus assembly protein [Streptomyces sp. AM 4-1-1]WEH37907.1 TadE/TadG family type IV pilus assembly protein [Streptomyces sp. AM 4-1-1]
MRLRRTVRRWSRALAERDARDRGAMSLEMLIIFPVVLMAILLVVHVGLWWHAKNVAMSAAQLGVESARVRGASAGAGTTEAREFLSRAGGSISGTSVSGSKGATVTIRVTGYVDTMIPGLKLRIDQHADAAAERVTEAR